MLSEKAFNYLSAPPKRFNILHGSVRSSKTTTALLALPERVQSAPKGDILITGRTERTAFRNVIKPLQEMFGYRLVKYNKGMGEGKIGSRDFYVIGGTNEASATKIQGMTVSYWHGDEAVTYPQSFFDMAVTRMSPEGACCDLTMNPGGPYHYIKKTLIDQAEFMVEDVNIWHFVLADNLNLTKDYIRSLKRLYPKNSLFYKRYIDGLWVYAEGAIYDFFDEKKHRLPAGQLEELLQHRPPQFYTLSADYGTGNATSVGLYAHWKSPPMKNLKVARVRGYYHDSRIVGKQKTDTEYSQEILATFRKEQKIHRTFFVDPSAASFKQQLIRDGWTVGDATNDVLDGIRTQAKMLKNGEYIIGGDPSNDPCIQDYSAYLWDKKAQERGDDKPMKQNDHTKDEERYDLHTIYGQPEVKSVSYV